jgi:hypothetical protein
MNAENPTFEDLAASKRSRLDQLLRRGIQPSLAEVAGYEFRGFNMQSLTKVIGTRKFKKGFYGNPDEGHLWGYNIRVVQNGLDDPWIALPSDDSPERLAFFKVFPPKPSGRDADFSNSLVVDYAQWPDYIWINPARYILDYLVFPAQGNRDLLLGKSYFALGGSRIFMGYFILERQNRSDFKPS